MYLFDASSIVNLVKRGIIKVFASGSTIDLALYESINAIWKEYKLLKRFDKDVALEFIGIISDIFEVIDIFSIKDLEEEVFKIASKERLTIYDASYVAIAKENNLILITDDWNLRNKASNYVKTMSSTDFSSLVKHKLFC